MCMCNCIYIILKHFLDKYFFATKTQSKYKRKGENKKQKTEKPIEYLMLKKWRFFRWQYLKFNINN